MDKTAIIMAMSLIILLNVQSSFVFADTKVYVVYLGEKEHNDPESVTESHHQLLQPILGSNESVHDAIVCSYRHGFSGFAAKLTESQAQKLSGIWPESEMFNDNGYGPIPSRWKGGCESGEYFNASIDCNRKLIGAKYFIKGFNAEHGILNTTENLEYLSPRDYNGHGTHVSSTIGGSFTPNVSYSNLGNGTARGGAPMVHIAMYKACWLQGICLEADVLSAIDEAIHDGVDVLSLSLGATVPLYPETSLKELTSVGAFHAVANGIPVVVAAGNDGPTTQTISNVAPWIITVAATTLDRSFPTYITLGNNITILGQAIFGGPKLKFSSLFYPEPPLYGQCEYLSANRAMEGKVVLCFTKETNSTLVDLGIDEVLKAGGLGIIIARNQDYSLRLRPVNFVRVVVDFELGTDILYYIRSTGSPIVKIQASRTRVGNPVATKVATFSSRGRNSISPAILKPDIAAPGVNILAATSLDNSLNDKGFLMTSGTSMATPVVSGVVILLKSLYPKWSPAAIKSAIVTTAWKTDPSGEPIFADGSSRKLADPFDYGGGLINPEKATRPGLVYDMTIHDYILYLCSATAGYSDKSISLVFRKATVCPKPRPSVLDLNLPSITIPNLKEKVTLTRTVTNVGPPNSVYKVFVDPPIGVNVNVTPSTLVFNTTTTKLSYTVCVSTTHKVNTGYFFGSLTWTDNLHNVAIPVSVRTQILQRYQDEN